jgi:hypothetical protein
LLKDGTAPPRRDGATPFRVGVALAREIAPDFSADARAAGPKKRFFRSAEKSEFRRCAAQKREQRAAAAAQQYGDANVRSVCSARTTMRSAMSQ